ncbi:hypothetical protein G6R29_04180 [Fructobacillus sp. M2-14]|uniref:Integral membrane protein n=1 Tax=Fructobacillus broussonetiae TaxID=2713173 RepID=A0ABS5R2D8_9LACO|nr:hypothetical protein [Fructobacillus broussonetiae]MBS9338821.1 hypothetical protein [Fructobacillus broussonetiae]
MVEHDDQQVNDDVKVPTEGDSKASSGFKFGQQNAQNFFSRARRNSEEKAAAEENKPSPAEVYAKLPAVNRWTVPVVAIAFPLIWWLKPMLNGTLVNRLTFAQVWPLLLYSFCTALAMGFLISSRFVKKDWRVYAALVASLVVLVNSSLRTRFEILALLLLFLLVLAILPFTLVQLQNGLGLLALTSMVAFTVPVCITFLANNYVDNAFLNEAWTFFYTTLFYLTPLVLPKAKGRLLGLLTGSAFLINVLLFHAFGTGVIVALVLTLGTYVLSFIRPLTYRVQAITASIALLLTMLFI